MSDTTLRVRFDGPILDDHSIDVIDLAPSLMALADVLTRANRQFNGDKTHVHLKVFANVHQNCFELGIELSMTILNAARELLSSDTVSAADLLRWVGLLGVSAASDAPCALSLIRLIQRLGSGSIIKADPPSTDSNNTATTDAPVSISIQGNNNHVNVYQVMPQALSMLNDEGIVQSVKKLVEPVTKPGYEKIEFEETPSTKEVITQEQAAEILKVSPAKVIEDLEEKEDAQTVTAWVKVFSPVYEENAQKWRFVYNERHEYMDISATDIAKQAMERGGALVDDMYRVRLEMVQSKITTKVSYKILEVLEFIPARVVTQSSLAGM